MNQIATAQTYQIKFPALNFIIFAFGILKLLIHFFTINNYGLHADELYYIELSDSFNWGFLDISPFVTWIAKVSEYTFGNSVAAFRILPCIFSAGTVMLTGWITQLMGGNRLAVIIACSAIICSPSFLATSYLLQPAVFDEFFWTLLTFSIIAYKKTKKITYIYLCAIAFGFGMLNKYSIIILLAAFLISEVFVDRKFLTQAFKKLAGPTILFFLIILPNLIWQWAYGFPIINYTMMVGKGAFKLDIFDYLFQLFFFHGASVAIWTAGLLFLLFNHQRPPKQEAWSISFVMIIILLALLDGKLYYGLGIFPVLFAAGGCCWALVLEKFKNFSSIFFVGMLYAFGLMSLPIVIPILSTSNCRLYVSNMIKLTGFTRPLRYQDGKQGEIPQFFSDMLEWEKMTNKVNRAANLTTIKDTGGICILTDNYAIAGALKYYGGVNMPKVISVHNSFLLQSPQNLHIQNIIYLSKEPLSRVRNLAKEVFLLETIKMENSHLNGISIYRLTFPSAIMKKKYTNDRRSFYANLKPLRK
ncbi:ArnT family glycosyltransferase [Pedobacter agri]|uniref:ArnT family glycosyltransferase n=1 Tax=Pedobacter agri TaxID=454586 RepID=UPI002931CC9C|nr:glycosyltransferase family 39 protein [Pedobacter agri]